MFMYHIDTDYHVLFIIMHVTGRYLLNKQKITNEKLMCVCLQTINNILIGKLFITNRFGSEFGVAALAGRQVTSHFSQLKTKI